MTVFENGSYAKPKRGPKSVKSGFTRERSPRHPPLALSMVPVLGSKFERWLSASDQTGVVDLGVEDRRILPLRIGRLAAEVGVTAHGFSGKTARGTRIGWQPGDAVCDAGVGRAQRRGVLATLRTGDAESKFEDL